MKRSLLLSLAVLLLLGGLSACGSAEWHESHARLHQRETVTELIILEPLDSIQANNAMLGASK